MWVAKRVPHRPGFPTFLEEADRSQQRSDRGWRSQGPLGGRRATGHMAEPQEALSRGSHTEILGFLLSCTDEASGKRDQDDPQESHPGPGRVARDAGHVHRRHVHHGESGKVCRAGDLLREGREGSGRRKRMP